MSEIMLDGAVGGVNLVDHLLGPVTWTFEGHLRVGFYHDEEAGVESTLRNPHAWGTVQYLDGKTIVTFNSFSLGTGDSCGTFQVDVERFAGDSSKDGTFNTGRNCGSTQIVQDPKDPTPTPESSTLLLFTMGLVLIAYRVRKNIVWGS